MLPSLMAQTYDNKKIANKSITSWIFWNFIMVKLFNVFFIIIKVLVTAVSFRIKPFLF